MCPHILAEQRRHLAALGPAKHAKSPDRCLKQDGLQDWGQAAHQEDQLIHQARVPADGHRLEQVRPRVGQPQQERGDRVDGAGEGGGDAAGVLEADGEVGEPLQVRERDVRSIAALEELPGDAEREVGGAGGAGDASVQCFAVV